MDEDLQKWLDAAERENDTAAVPRTGFADRTPVVGTKPKGGRPSIDQLVMPDFALRHQSLGDIARGAFSKGGLRAAAQGATFGFGDELEAMARAPFSDRTYPEIRDDIRGQNAAFAAENPDANLLLQLGGGMGTGMAAARGFAALARPVVGGLIGGAVAGAGYDDSHGPVPLGSMAKGSLVGGAFGAVLPKALRWAGDRPMNFEEAAQAAAAGPKLSSAEKMMVRGGNQVVKGAGGEDKLRANAADMAGSPAIVADAAGTPGMRVLRAQQAVPGDLSDDITNTLEARRQGAYSRIRQSIVKGMGGDAVDTKEAARQVSKAAGELADLSYGEVFERGTSVEGDDLVRLLRNPTVRKAWERVTAIDRNLRDAGQGGRYHLDLWKDTPGATGTGTNLPAPVPSTPGREVGIYDDFIQRGSMDLKSADALKRGLDDLIGNGWDGRTPGGLRGEEKGSVVALKNKLLELADAADEAGRQQQVGLSGRGTDIVLEGQAATPGKSYREARQEFATAMGWREALADGEKVLTMPTEEVRTLWGTLTPEQREVARVGFRSKVLDRLGRGGEGRDRTKGLLNEPRFKETVRVLFGQDGDEFLRTLKTETAIAGTDSKVLSGSPTARIQAEMASGGTDFGGALRDATDLTGAAGRGFGSLMNYGLRKGAQALDRYQTGTVGEAGGWLARQQLRPASKTGDFLDELAQLNKRQGGRPTPTKVARGTGMFGGFVGGRR